MEGKGGVKGRREYYKIHKFGIQNIMTYTLTHENKIESLKKVSRNIYKLIRLQNYLQSHNFIS